MDVNRHFTIEDYAGDLGMLFQGVPVITGFMRNSFDVPMQDPAFVYDGRSREELELAAWRRRALRILWA